MDTAFGPPKAKILALTSLRFFAAFYVVLYHTAFTANSDVMSQPLIGRVLALGFVSVSFFFLLSGYILALVYLKEAKPIDRKAFYLARFARVYPLFFLTMLLDTPFLLLHRIMKFGTGRGFALTAATFATTTAMLQAWSIKLQGIDDPNWSLSVETIFYLLFPILGVLLWRLQRNGLALTALAIYLGGQLLVILSLHSISEPLSFLYPLLHISTFALGILLARWQVLEGQRGLSPSSLRTTSLLLLSVTAFAAVAFWSPHMRPGNLHDGLLAPIFALLILVFSDCDSFPAKLLSAPWLVILGEASFGLYLIHIPLLHVFQMAGMAEGPVFYIVYLGCCVGLSVLSFYHFETPVRRWILQHTKRKQLVKLGKAHQPLVDVTDASFRVTP